MKVRESAWLIVGFAFLVTVAGTMRVAAAPPPEAEGPIAEAVGRLAERLTAHPIRPATGTVIYGLFLLDLEGGPAVPIVAEPLPGFTYCGSPWWSRDGHRILFDSTPGTSWDQTHLLSIDLGDAAGKASDLGLGNCASLSPDGGRIAFLSNAPGAELGVYQMKADGTERALLSAYGRPKWSPDDREILLGRFSDPCELSLVDPETKKMRPTRLGDKQFFSVSSWAESGTIAAVIGGNEPDAIALVDVRRAEKVQIEIDLTKVEEDRVVIDTRELGNEAKVKEVLWTRGSGPDVIPSCPVYHPGTRRCVFVGGEPRGKALYAVVAGDPAPPRRLEPERIDSQIMDLTLSPDGRYLIFASTRANR